MLLLGRVSGYVFLDISHLLNQQLQQGQPGRLLRLHYPPSIHSSVASAFQPGMAELDYNNSMGVGAWAFKPWHIWSVIALFPKRPFELILVGLYMWAPLKV